MHDILKRVSLSTQAAMAIHRNINDGTWKEFLPSERRLCEMFQVSRPTVSTALHMLAKDGLIKIRQGRRNRIIRRQRVRVAVSRLVAIVTQEAVTNMAQITYQGISEMRTHLAKHGFDTEILVCESESVYAQRRKLLSFVRENHVYCCVLISVPRELQQWFVNHSIPALVLGSCHASVKLPSLDVDYRSVCRHAGGVFLGKGHRRIALIVPDFGVAGDLASEQGFKEAVQQRIEHDDAEAIIIRHKGSAVNLGHKLDALFKSPRAPTALLVAKSQYVFIVILYLLKRGLSVPNVVSLLARDQDSILAKVSPPISHYFFDRGAFNDQLIRLILQMVDQGYLAPKPHLIFPKFFAGETIKRPPDSRSPRARFSPRTARSY